MNNSPIFIIDSDIDDQELLQEAWHELKYSNKLLFFKNAEDAIHHLETKPEVPFLIISEIKLPKMTGLELKHYLIENPHTNFKSIPFVFLTASPSQEQIEQAYKLCANGLFKKGHSFEKLKTQLIEIANYWSESLVPSNDETAIKN